MPQPDLTDARLIEQTRLLCDSYRRWTGKILVTETADCSLPAALFSAPFVLVSHGTEPVPVFNYANHKALDLFGLDWKAFTRTPSFQSADQENQSDRAELMARVKANGYATGCSGIRISATGRRFRIDGATVWNVVDSKGCYHGQAAMFDQWTYL
ncbi:MAG TPA: MEKHLA domain-containing protein [Gammaproteobacteria bacterium]|nr:MEKHLA domain-containing protein [Gammaproteobacteria bacterium]